MKLKLLKTLFYKFFKNNVHRINLKEWFIKILNECRIFLRMKEDFFEKYIFYRKGFIKIALQHGAQLVPTFSFGEAYYIFIISVVLSQGPGYIPFRRSLKTWLGLLRSCSWDEDCFNIALVWSRIGNLLILLSENLYR